MMSVGMLFEISRKWMKRKEDCEKSSIPDLKEVMLLFFLKIYVIEIEMFVLLFFFETCTLLIAVGLG
jgi:hypothetical protein